MTARIGVSESARRIRYQMSEPKYISKERQEAEALDDEELVVMFGNVSQPDDYDGVFTTRGLNIYEAYEKVVINRLANLRAELARRDEIIKRLKEDGERLAKRSGYWDDYGNCYSCVHEDGLYEPVLYDHTPDCPITLHRALMKELEND